MPLPTCEVTVRCYTQDGQPDPGAVVIAKLNHAEVYEGYVVPEEAEAVADADGIAILTLFRNALGYTGSIYKIRIEGTSGSVVKVTTAVPDQASAFLEDIATLPAYPGKPDGVQAVEDATEQAEAAAASAAAADESADVAAQSELNAGLSELAAAGYADDAEAARDAAQTAQGLSEAARDAAQTAQGLSETAQVAAQAAESSAEEFATIAGTLAGAIIRKTWAVLNGIVGADGDNAVVLSNDTGTHTDPVVGGTVNNAGVYQYSTAPAGWERIGDTEAVRAQDAAASRYGIYVTGSPVPLGGYPAERSARTASTIRRFFYDVDATCTVEVHVNGVIAHTGLDINGSGEHDVTFSVPADAEVDFYITAGTPTSVWVHIDGSRP